MNERPLLYRRVFSKGTLSRVDRLSRRLPTLGQVGMAAVRTVHTPDLLDRPCDGSLRRPAIFLDRDGVIIENRDDYVKSIDEVLFLPNALGALRRLYESEYVLVMITNQSAVGRGIITLEEALDINGSVISAIEAAGGRIDASYICPHRPDDNCDCRKPAPGMIMRAVDELRLDRTQSFMVGDAGTDVLASLNAGVRPVQLLSSPKSDRLPFQDDAWEGVAEEEWDLEGAVGRILGKENGL